MRVTKRRLVAVTVLAILMLVLMAGHRLGGGRSVDDPRPEGCHRQGHR